MATLDPNYVVGINLGEYFVDKDTGLPLAGGKIYFYKDEARAIPKTVYQLTGSPPNYLYEALPNPIILSAVGTIVNADGENVAVYYYPFDSQGNIENYYIKVFSEDDVEQFNRQAWPNVTDSSTNPINPGNGTTVQNQLSNSQFVDVSFPTDTGLDLSWTGALSESTYTIAPDWNLVIEASGTGSVSINRNSIVGSLNVTTNPPYELDIVASSVNITSLKLVQRLSNNPDIWAQQFVSAVMLVQALDGISRTFSMVYAPSIAVANSTIVEGSSGDSGYIELKGSVQLPEGTNSDDSNDGYVDIEIILPVAGHYTITSLQLTNSDAEPTIDNIVYQQDPVNRQQDFSFHHYRPQIIQLAVPSLLEGWDFRVNPAQWGSSQSLAAVRSQYVWDQTIVYQSVDSAISVDRGDNNGLQVNIGTTCQFALIQYIDVSEAQQLLQSNFSTLLTALTDIEGGVTGTVSFWATSDSSLPNVATGTNLSIVASLDANGKPATFNGNWTEIARTTGWDAQFTISQGSEYTQIPLEGWTASVLATAATYTFCAIVIGFSSTDIGSINLQSVSVTPTLIASPYAPLSYSLTLNQLRRYWEQSYQQGVVPGTVTNNNAIVQQSDASVSYNDVSAQNVNFFINPIFLYYKTSKSNIPVFTPYSPSSGNVNEFRTFITSSTGAILHSQDVNFSNFNTSISNNYTDYYFMGALPHELYNYIGSSSDLPYTYFISLHFTADSRLGII
jgi:hypothetical protein